MRPEDPKEWLATILALLGVALVVGAAAWIWPPAGLIGIGLLLILVGSGARALLRVLWEGILGLED